MTQENRDKAMIRIMKDIKTLSLTTADIKYIKDHLERIWVEQVAKEQILKFTYNDPNWQKVIQKMLEH